MAWYYILFFSVLVFFLFKTVLSWMFGDTDVDFDADDDIDFDVSSMLSFKGVLHFLLGFSTYLSATAHFDRTYNEIGYYQFTWVHYTIAVAIGVLFMIGLWYLYKLMMKLNHSNQNNPDFVGCDCSVLTNLGGGRYVVSIRTALGTFKKTLYHISKNTDIQIGSELRIAKNLSTNEYVMS